MQVFPIGWRKISCFFNISFEIRDKNIEFDENRNVNRAEFVVRAYMQYVSCLLVAIHVTSYIFSILSQLLHCYFIRGGRFSDGWGSCDRREKRFQKPNHDVPSTAETRAKNKACQVGHLHPCCESPYYIFQLCIATISHWLQLLFPGNGSGSLQLGLK